MTNILRVDSSINGADACSPKLTAYAVDRLRDKLGTITLTHRDVGEQPLPAYTQEVMNDTRAAESKEHDRPLKELIAADYVVIGAPMYNFSVPSSLKAWMDYCAVPNISFKYTDSGPVGLLKHKKVIVCTTRGSEWKDTEHDYVAPLLKFYLAFLGLEDVEIVYAEGLNMGKKDESMKQAREAIDKIVVAL